MFDGSVVIASGVPENLKLGSIGNIQETLLVKGVSNLKSLALPVIGYVKELILDDLPDFEELILPTSYPAAIQNQEWTALPSLTKFPGYAATCSAEYISIQDTAVTSLQIDSLSGVLKSVAITGNPHLEDISSNVTQISKNLTITDNGNLKTIDGFAKLGSVGDFIEVQGDFTK